MLSLLVSLIIAYLIGSIPTSFIFAKILKKIDIREYGSRNVGATNVFRVVGKIPALIVLLLDIFKGVISVAFLPGIFFNNTIEFSIGLEPYRILLGLFVISGHVWSVFLKFRGGKGVATSAGVLMVLAPKVLIGSAAMWALVFLIFRIVSVASITSAVFLPIFAIIFQQPLSLIIFCVLLCIMGTFKHKDNIRRLLRGEEKKLFLVFLLLCFIGTSYARDTNLYEMFKDSPHIKVYLEDVANEVENTHINVDTFKDIFKEVLVKRLGIKFIPVDNASQADVVVLGKIKKYVFKEKVMPSFFGTAALVADTAAPKSAAKLVVDYKIISPKDGKTLFSYKNFTTDERRPYKDMLGEKAFTHAATKNINRFIYRAFYKQKR